MIEGTRAKEEAAAVQQASTNQHLASQKAQYAASLGQGGPLIPDHFEWVDVGAMIERERDMARLNSPYNAISANPNAHIYIPSQAVNAFTNPPLVYAMRNMTREEMEAEYPSSYPAAKPGSITEYWSPSPTLWTRIKGWLGL